MHDTYESAQELLKRGGVGILPTDTLYGVVGSALDTDAVERVYRVKEREPEKPFIILIAEPEEAQFDVQISDSAEKKLNVLWPGPNSVILPCKSERFAYLHRGTNTLAFRVPDDEKLRTFLKEIGPLVAPSANIAGQEPAHTISEARAYFGDTVDFYVDGGELNAAPSNLIDMTSQQPVVLRGNINI